MTMLWIGIGLGIVLTLVLIRKYFQTPKYDYVKIDFNCKNCGYRTNGLKCPQCEHEKISKNPN